MIGIHRHNGRRTHPRTRLRAESVLATEDAVDSLPQSRGQPHRRPPRTRTRLRAENVLASEDNPLTPKFRAGIVRWKCSVFKTQACTRTMGGTSVSVTELATSPQIEKILNAADQLTPTERLFIARRLLDSILAGKIEDDQDWRQMSLSSFEKDWDNEDDAIYDEWRTHYDVPAR